jgi:hypothetical protein
MRATRFVWEALGCPPPRDSDGAPISPRDLVRDLVKERRRVSEQVALWRAAGREEDAQNAEQMLARLGDAQHCAMCCAPASYFVTDAISDNFTTVVNLSLLYPHGGGALCAACLWSFKTILAKACLYFVRRKDEHGEGGWWPVGMLPLRGIPGTRPDALAALLDPPPPPFVACYPMMGVEQGGEQNIERLTLDYPWEFFEVRKVAEQAEEALAPLMKTAPRSKDAAFRPDHALRWALARCTPPSIPQPADEAEGAAWRASFAATPAWQSWLRAAEPHRRARWFRAAVHPLIKLQSKHTLPFARVSMSRVRYHLAVDDGPGVEVDVPLWRLLRAVGESLLADMRACGVGAEDARAALMPPLAMPLLRPAPEQRGRAMSLMTTWAARARSLAPYVGTLWWQKVLLPLLPMPELIKTTAASSRRKTAA